MLAVPGAFGVKLTRHVEDDPDPVSVHELKLKFPVAVPPEAKFTVPEGVEGVPGFEGLSCTVAVQVDGWLTLIVDGVQETEVSVGRRLTVTLEGVPVLLPLCPKSPP